MRVCSYCHLLLADSESVCSHDGAPTRTAEVPPIPPQLHDKFTSLEPYARGQTGTCHIATQQQSGYRGLLKVIPLSGIEASERVRLKRELRKQTRLSHDALPRIIDGGEVGAQLWLFREYIQGESLAQRIRRLGKLEPGEALAITAQVASALDELQRNGLLHRDVKPGHIVLQQGGSGTRMAKLIDSGVAARLPTGSVFGLLGTPAYISPEQVAGKLISFRSDLYALGCVLFEMLSGQPPFPDEDVQAVLEAHKSVAAPELQLELPNQVRTLLHGLLAKEPRQRPFSAQQVRRTLEPLLPAGTPLPAVGTRAPASSLAPRAPGGRASFPTEVLDDVELEELAVSSVGLNPLGPKTLHLSDDEVDALEVGADAASLPSNAPDSGVVAERDARAAGETVGGPTASVRASTPPKAPDPRTARLQDAVAQDPDSGVGEARMARSSTASQSAPSEGASPAKPVLAGRRSVDFDVESLFEDDVVSEPVSLQDAVPTQLFRPRGDDGAPTQFAAKPSAPQPASSQVALDPAAPAEPDPDGTVLTARKTSRPMRVLPWVIAGAVVAVVAFALLGRHERGPQSAARAANSPPQPDPGVAPSAEPAVVPQPEPLVGANANTGAAVQATGTPDKQEPAAGQELGKDQRPQLAAAAEPTAPGTASPTAPTEAKGTQAQAASATTPSPEATSPSGSTAAAAKPQAGGDSRAAVIPATIAAGSGTSEKANAAATPSPTRTAELTAANAAGRAQTGAGDARLPAPGPRADRVSKGDEYKAQGRENYQAGRFKEAAAAYQKATEQNPADAGAFAGLAASRLAAGDAAAAIQAYSRAVRLQPDSSGFHAALGRAYLQKGDRDRARSAYKHALELNPNNAAAKAALEQLK